MTALTRRRIAFTKPEAPKRRAEKDDGDDDGDVALPPDDRADDDDGASPDAPPTKAGKTKSPHLQFDQNWDDE